MSDRMTNVEIEDVISSIRRLVAEDDSGKDRVPTAAERLVLTEALRVVDDLAKAGKARGAEAPASRPEDKSAEASVAKATAKAAKPVSESGPLRLGAALSPGKKPSPARVSLADQIDALEKKLRERDERWERESSPAIGARDDGEAFETGDGDAEVNFVRPDAEPGTAELAEVETPATAKAEVLAFKKTGETSEAQAEKAQPGKPDAEAIAAKRDVAAPMSAAAAEKAEAEAKKQADEAKAAEAAAEKAEAEAKKAAAAAKKKAAAEAKKAAAEAKKAAAKSKLKAKASAAPKTTAAPNAGPAPRMAPAEAEAPAALSTASAQPSTQAEAESGVTAAAAPAMTDGINIEADPTTAIGTELAAPKVTSLANEAELRLLVADVLREELKGPLGERITRNVRKLVRREIAQALSSIELD